MNGEVLGKTLKRYAAELDDEDDDVDEEEPDDFESEEEPDDFEDDEESEDDEEDFASDPFDVAGVLLDDEPRLSLR